MDTFRKQPTERLDYGVKTSTWMVSGDSITDTKVSIDDGALGLSVPANGLLAEVAGGNTTYPQIWVENGTDAVTYKLSVVMTMVSGRVKEHNFKVKVKDI